MIHLTATTPILLAKTPADFRCGIDGFVALCKGPLACYPRDGTVFVFINKRKTMIRALCYDGTGYWLMSKRLSQGRFQGWPRGEGVDSVAAGQLRVLLMGQDWQKA